MTSLAIGASVTLTLGNNGFLEVATNGGLGSVTITPIGGAAVSASFGPSPFRKKYAGPYPEGASVLLSNSSAASMDYETDSTNLPASVQALVSGDGNRTLATIGDSFIAQGFYSDATQTTRYGKNWVEWGLALSGHRLSLISQNAAGGSRITGAGTGVAFDAQMASAIASGATDILMMGGINDVINSVTLAAMQAQYTTLIAAAVAAGRKVWIATQPGLNSAGSNYSTTRQATMMEFNRWLKDRVAAAGNPRVQVIDCAGQLADAASATGSWRANSILASDGLNLHPNNVGAYWMGKALAAAWSANLPAWDRRHVSNADAYTYNAASRQALSNPLFVNGAGTATNWTIAYTGSGAGTASQVDRADGYGKDQTVALTAGADGDFFTITSDNAYPNGIAAGDVVVFEVEVTFSAGPVNVKGLRAVATQNGTTFITSTSMAFDTTGTNDLALPESFTAVLRTPPMTISTGQTSLTGAVRAILAGNPTGTTLKIGRASMRKLYGAY